MKSKKIIISVLTIIVLLAGIYFYISSRSYAGTFQGINIKNDTTMLLIGDSKENAKELKFLKLNKDKSVTDNGLNIKCTNGGTSKDVPLKGFISDLAIGVTNLKVKYLLGNVNSIEYSFDANKLNEYKSKIEEEKLSKVFTITCDEMRIVNGSNIARYSYTAPKGTSNIYGVTYEDNANNMKVEKFIYTDGIVTRATDTISVDQTYMKKFKILLYSANITYNTANLFDVGFKSDEDMKNNSNKFAIDLMDAINKINDAEFSEGLKLELTTDKLISTNYVK